MNIEDLIKLKPWIDGIASGRKLQIREYTCFDGELPYTDYNKKYIDIDFLARHPECFRFKP